MKKSTYMDRALRSRDPRYARVLSKLGYERRDMMAEPGYERSDMVAEPNPEGNADDLAALRAEYLDVVGKRAFHGWDADALREKIAEAKE